MFEVLSKTKKKILQLFIKAATKSGILGCNK